MNGSSTYIKILFFSVAVLLTLSLVHAQEKVDLEKMRPKRFIDELEVLFGVSTLMLNDHGYSEFIASSSAGKMDANFSSKWGYSYGVGLVHSFSDQIDLAGRVQWQRNGFIQKEQTTTSGNIHIYQGDYRLDYLNIVLLPHFFFKKSRFHLLTGMTWGKLLSSYRDEKLYLNGQQFQQSSTTNDPNLKEYLFDLCVGLGYSIPLSKNNSIALQLIGNQGLTDIMNVNKLRLTSQSLSFNIILKHT